MPLTQQHIGRGPSTRRHLGGSGPIWHCRHRAKGGGRVLRSDITTWEEGEAVKFEVHGDVDLNGKLQLGLNGDKMADIAVNGHKTPRIAMNGNNAQFNAPVVPNAKVDCRAELSGPSGGAEEGGAAVDDREGPRCAPPAFPAPARRLPAASRRPVRVLTPARILRRPPTAPAAPPQSKKGNKEGKQRNSRNTGGP